jgi:hypothetical protein
MLFDDKGFCYAFNLRARAVHTSIGAIEMLENAFNTVPSGVKKYLVADSGSANLDMYNHLITKKASFAICLGEMVWGSILKKYGNKITWRKTRIKFFESQKCELGSCLYPLKGLAEKRSHLRVVFIRTKKNKIESGDNHPYHYYAIVTDLGSAEMNDEHIIRFYRKRAIVENNIKDLKQGMDFYHFPCQSLQANNVWGLMGVMAYNLMSVTYVSGINCNLYLENGPVFNCLQLLIFVKRKNFWKFGFLKSGRKFGELPTTYNHLQNFNFGSNW